MLARVVPDVFNEHLVTADVNRDHDMWPYGSLVKSSTREGRSVIVGADGGAFMVGYIPELNVQMMVCDEEYGDEEDAEEDREKALRELCSAMLVYLEGGGQVGERRSLLGRGVVRKLIIESDGRRWRLGRNFGGSDRLK